MPTLVLSRKVGETLILNDGATEIRLTIVRNWQGKVRIAIEAPLSVKVVRSELIEMEPKPCTE
jgi:carbon storage regulator CsrA